MNRRNFLGLFSAGVAGLALEQAIPLGRVWSFPSKIVIPRPGLDIGDVVIVKEVWRKVRNPMPERWIVSRKVGDRLYEVMLPDFAPFTILQSYIEPWPTPAFPRVDHRCTS
jgi:hypothetical protein